MQQQGESQTDGDDRGPIRCVKIGANHPEAAAAIASAIVSLVFSVVVFRRQSALTRRQTDLQERVTRIEEERRSRREADVTLRFDSREEELRSGKITHHLVILHNRGPAVARDVEVKLEGVDSTNLPFVPEDMLPILLLDSAQEYPIRLSTAWGDAVLFDAIVTWHDDEGRRRSGSGEAGLTPRRQRTIRGSWPAPLTAMRAMFAGPSCN
jgi:hypothetical protein